MQKVYEGYALPGDDVFRYTIEFECPKCGSGFVKRDVDDTRPIVWFDGLPSTEDELRYWLCETCGERAIGREMMMKRSRMEKVKKD